MMADSLTKMIIQRVVRNDEKGSSLRELFEEVKETLEERDERFKKMGLYYQEERDQTLMEEVKRIKGG